MACSAGLSSPLGWAPRPAALFALNGKNKSGFGWFRRIAVAGLPGAL
jgi:hypothetical protein